MIHSAITRSGLSRTRSRETKWGLLLREPFSDNRLIELTNVTRVDPTGEKHLIMRLLDWPLDRDSQRLITDTISDLYEIGVTGHFTPVIMEKKLTETAVEYYSFARIVRNDGIALRVRRFKSSVRDEAQFGFIDEDGKERVGVGKIDARLAYAGAIAHNMRNPRNSLDSGQLIVAVEPSNTDDRRRFEVVVRRLANSGFFGEISFVEDVVDFCSLGYERRHVLVHLKTPHGILLAYCEFYVDGVLAWRNVSNGNQHRNFDDHHAGLSSGAASERELCRRLFIEMEEFAIHS